jgi:uncharacterized membrane protein
MTYVVHIAAGVLVVLAGFVALYTTKGAPLHRRAGMVFFYAMLTTALFGITIAVVRDVAPAVNVPAALLTSYLVITSLTTIRPPVAGSRWLAIGAFLVVLGVTLASFTFAFEAFANGGLRKGMPAFPFLLFGVAGLFASVGDVRVLRSGALTGARRLARHLWRMSFALFIAALSFFIGQGPKIFPEPFSSPALLGLPVLLVLVTMFYWLWRVRVRRNLRGFTLAEAHS